MPESRNDSNKTTRSRQYLRTDRDIRNALLTLLDDHPFEKITVQDILDEAMINRSTFYQHYPDKYAVIEDLQQIYIDEMDSIFRQIMERTRNGERRDFPEMDKLFSKFFKKNRSTLRKLMRIRTSQTDIRESAKRDFLEYCRGLLPSGKDMTPEAELQISLLAGLYMDFLEFFVDHEELPGGYTASMYNAFLKITKTFFRLESPEASDALIHVIETYALK